MFVKRLLCFVENSSEPCGPWRYDCSVSSYRGLMRASQNRPNGARQRNSLHRAAVGAGGSRSCIWSVHGVGYIYSGDVDSE